MKGIPKIKAVGLEIIVIYFDFGFVCLFLSFHFFKIKQANNIKTLKSLQVIGPGWMITRMWEGKTQAVTKNLPFNHSRLTGCE